MVRQRSIQNRWPARVLIILFMLPVVLKAFHQHEEPHCCHAVEDTQQDSSEHAHDDCLICHFFYSSFTGIEFDEAEVFFTLIRTESVSYLFAETFPTPHAYYLRGPPVNA
ncbi:MAG: hypothetical protein LIP06_08410 [Tannerellaceae bacterium]|nr:hypothetical protein [Tannerellaceae bacterium]